MKEYGNNAKGSTSIGGKEAACQLYGGPPQAKPSAKAGGDGAKTEPPPEYEDLFGRPALSEEAEARHAAEDYRKDLRSCYGPGVPEREVEAFEAVFRVARRHAQHTEAMKTALRVGAAESQRRKAASCGGGDGR